MLENSQFRPPDSSDVSRLWALDQVCFPPGIAYSRGEIRAILQREGRGFHLGIFSAGRSAAPTMPEGGLIGFILTLRNRGRGHVITVDVNPEHRHCGVGQTLMGAAERHYREQGAVGMRLEVAVNNFAALRFYARLGYRVVRILKAYYADDLDGLLLHKEWIPPESVEAARRCPER